MLQFVLLTMCCGSRTTEARDALIPKTNNNAWKICTSIAGLWWCLEPRSYHGHGKRKRGKALLVLFRFILLGSLSRPRVAVLGGGSLQNLGI